MACRSSWSYHKWRRSPGCAPLKHSKQEIRFKCIYILAINSHVDPLFHRQPNIQRAVFWLVSNIYSLKRSTLLTARNTNSPAGYWLKGLSCDSIRWCTVIWFIHIIPFKHYTNQEETQLVLENSTQAAVKIWGNIHLYNISGQAAQVDLSGFGCGAPASPFSVIPLCWLWPGKILTFRWPFSQWMIM